jgi:hypothetical protein
VCRALFEQEDTTHTLINKSKEEFWCTSVVVVGGGVFWFYPKLLFVPTSLISPRGVKRMENHYDD